MAQTTRTGGASSPPTGNGAGRDESRLKALDEKAQLAIEQYKQLEQALRGPTEQLFDPDKREKTKDWPKTDWSLPQPLKIVERLT